jgi:hypothetical protein
MQNNAATVTAAFAKVLQANGKPLSSLRLIIPQVAHETGGFRHRLSQPPINNMSGIKWRPKTALKGEKDSGIKSPEGDNYAAYDTLDVWAQRHYNIINRGVNKPLDALNVTDFAKRLKDNKYYTAPLDLYTNALVKWEKQLSKTLADVPQIAKTGAVILLLIFITFLILQ